MHRVLLSLVAVAALSMASAAQAEDFQLFAAAPPAAQQAPMPSFQLFASAMPVSAVKTNTIAAPVQQPRWELQRRCYNGRCYMQWVYVQPAFPG